MLRAVAVFSLILVLSILAAVPLISASPSLTASVQTSKLWYNTSENISVYGKVLQNGTPLLSVAVALEIQDPVGSTVITRSLQTNSSGVYTVTFKLQQDAPTGSYNVYVSCTYGGENVFNGTSFQASALATTITTDKGLYDVGENITVTGTVTLNGVKLPQVLVALEVQDPNATPVAVRVLETDSQGAYRLVFQLAAGSPLGDYAAFATANREGAIATAQTSFTLKRPTNSADINGDGVVNILDVVAVALAWGSSPGSPRWDPRCDLDGNGLINIIDIYIVARAFGTSG